ncbi:MAG: MBL fold metallo-hydrolase [Actinobacteria bacterium]|nr:MBL fold metallo-hydrolase [Actinomycetota bacterium]
MSLLVDRVVASYFGTNCWIVAPSRNSHCVVVDPGIGIPNLTKEIKAKLAEHNLLIGAIFITHGHLDHTFSLFSLSEDFVESDTYIHEADRDLLSNPEPAMGPQSQALLVELGKLSGKKIDFREPRRTWSIESDSIARLGGMNFSFRHAPGHTPGSTLAIVDDELLISGDVLFKAGIGRTDLPQGSISDMEITLREKIAPLPPHLRVLPGHGDESRMDEEMKSNQYLLSAIQGRLA